MSVRWYKKVTNQSAIIGGCFLVVTALIAGIFSLFSDPSSPVNPVPDTSSVYSESQEGLAANDSIGFYTDSGEWIAALDIIPYPTDTIIFETSLANMRLADGVDTIYDKGRTALKSQVTFYASETGLDLSFCLSHLGSRTLVYNDYFASKPRPGFISIGVANKQENDDFSIAVTGTFNNGYVFAMGFYLGNNIFESGEYLKVWRDTIVLKTYDENHSKFMWPRGHWSEKFLGIVSTSPITTLEFNEGAGGNDVYIRNFYFGVAYPGK